MKLLLTKVAVYTALALAPMPGKAHADFRYFDDGNDLFSQCVVGDADNLKYLKDAECRGFIIGVSDHLAMWRDTLDLPDCKPAGVRKGQIVAIVVKYLENHPEKRHEPANELVMYALNSAFCPKT